MFARTTKQARADARAKHAEGALISRHGPRTISFVLVEGIQCALNCVHT